MDLTAQKILVAGASGLIGRAVVKRFQEAGCKEILTPTHSELDLEDAAKVSAFSVPEAGPGGAGSGEGWRHSREQI